MTPLKFLVWLSVLVAAVSSGVMLVRSANTMRELHIELDAAQRAQDNELADYSRLLLERAAIAAYQNVERVARTELEMHFPVNVERVTR